MSNNKQRFEEIKDLDKQTDVSYLEQCIIDGDIESLVQALKKIIASMHEYNINESIRTTESDGIDLIMCKVLKINVIVPTKGFIAWLESKRWTDEWLWLNEDVAKYIMVLLSGEVVRYKMFVVPNTCYGLYRCSVYLEEGV